MIAIVIDTDVARAAGFSDSPAARLAADIFDIISSHDYALAFSKVLWDEWHKHRNGVQSKDGKHSWPFYMSILTHQYLAKLKTLGKIKMYDTNNYRYVCTSIKTKAPNDFPINRIVKDMHIILTALSADRRLISSNTRERLHFARACAWEESLAMLNWPESLEDALDWLRSGAPENRPLCVFAN